MIEFKAECGHTVRAKDDDAGDVVRCSYCGRQVSVPDNRDDNLDFLFSDIRQSEEPPDPGRRRKRGRLRRFFGPRRHPRPGATGFDPFGIILRMCYAALLLAIVIFVGDRYVVPLFREDGLSGRPGAPQPVPRKNTTTRTERKPVRRKGLIARKSPVGLYVGSTPPGAAVYCLEVSKAPSEGRIHEVSGCHQTQANGEFLRLPDGAYVVEVVLPWNDPRLNDPKFPNYQNYLTFRRAVLHASDEERIQRLEKYFVPDEARSVFIQQTDEQIYIVRQYGEVQVRNGRSKGVRALFLPKIVLPDRHSFSIAQLVTHYIPAGKAYGFNEEHVQNELNFFYDVPESDRSFVMEALSRIGVVPYVTRDGRTRLFKIDIDDGAFAAKVLREATE